MNPQGILAQKPLPPYLIELGHSVSRYVKDFFGKISIASSQKHLQTRAADGTTFSSAPLRVSAQQLRFTW